jgi:hypothetical protein
VPQIRSPLHSITDLEPGDRACFIHDTDEEHRNSITTFLRKGPERNEKVFFELSERPVICKDMTITGNGTGNTKKDKIISAVKNP